MVSLFRREEEIEGGLDSLSRWWSFLPLPRFAGLDDQDYMKHVMWRRWFDGPNESLGGISAWQASRTAKGRKEINELFDWYEKIDSSLASRPNYSPATSGRVPRKYAFWKLGMGPGSPEDFVEEERILNGFMNVMQQPTHRTERHEQRLHKKLRSIWIPKRCEVEGCDKNGDDDLRRCVRCKCVYYCCRSHQTRDWDHRKIECKFLAKKLTDVRPKAFRTEDDLKDHPIGCYPFQSVSAEKCMVCGAAATEVKLGHTPCCNIFVCDNEHEYEMLSESKEHCLRSHKRFTACHRHYEEKHEGKDWRECVICNEIDYAGATTQSYHSTNHFSVLPPLEKFLPVGSFLTFPCQGCKQRVLPGHDSPPGYNYYHHKQTFEEHRQICLSCLDSKKEQRHNQEIR